VRLGIITGSGSYTWPFATSDRARTIPTRYGAVQVAEGALHGVDVVHLSRHGAQHERLSHQVQHRANLEALLEAKVDALLSFTVCGAVDPALDPGSIVVFDDLYFPSNRLPDGSPCTRFDAPGAAGRGHWILDGSPFSQTLRRQALIAARTGPTPVVDGGVYGHVDGPRFNTRSEIRALARAGVTAISQTAGPEVVLAGEAELPMALIGYVTDYANGVAEVPEPVEALLERMAASRDVIASIVAAVLVELTPPSPAGTVYRFGA
jgi:5'-methylthioadenosine phosphorylase